MSEESGSDRESKSFESESGNKIEILLNEDEYYSYEKIIIDIKLTYKNNLTPQLPDWTKLDDSLTFVSIIELQGPLIEGENIIRVIQLVIEPGLPGLYLLNPIEINLIENDHIIDSVKTDYIPVNVISSLLNDSNDILENIELVGLDRKINYTIPALIILVLAVSISVLFIIIGKKQKKESLALIIEKNYELILDKMDDKEIIAFYHNLNNLLKDFLENKLYLSITTQTTEEFILSNKDSPIIEDWLKEQLFSFLRRSDEVKFSKIPPDLLIIKGDRKFCRDLMEYINNKIAGELAL